MEKEIYGILALLIFASPLVGLILIVIIKVWSAAKKRQMAQTLPDPMLVTNHDIFAPKTIEQLRAESTIENFANTEKGFYKSPVKVILLLLAAVFISIMGGVLTGIAVAFIGSF